MTDAETPKDSSDNDARTAPAARPSQPVLGPRAATDARPVRPSIDRTVKSLDATPAEMAEAVVVARPPSPPKPAGRPSVFAAVGLRKTMIPPCLVLGVGCIALGIAYFRQPPDAALRQIAAAVPTALLAAGGVAITLAAALAWSVRRH